MKKIFASLLIIVMIASLTVSASAATAGAWDLSAAQNHVNQTITRMYAQDGFKIPTYTFDWSNFTFTWSGF